MDGADLNTSPAEDSIPDNSWDEGGEASAYWWVFHRGEGSSCVGYTCRLTIVFVFSNTSITIYRLRLGRDF